MPESISLDSVFSEKTALRRIGIYFHGDDQYAESVRHEMSKRTDASRVLTRALKHYGGEVEDFHEVYVTHNAQLRCPNIASLLAERYQAKKIPVKGLEPEPGKESQEKPRELPEAPAAAQVVQPADEPKEERRTIGDRSPGMEQPKPRKGKAD